MGHMKAWGVVAISLSLLLSSPASAAGPDQRSENSPPVRTTRTKGAVQKQRSAGYQPACLNRSPRQYQYFPSVCVYHDANRGLYFFPRGSEWRIAVSLPSELRMQLGDYVTVEMDSDKPYLFNAQHKKQYPSGRKK